MDLQGIPKKAWRARIIEAYQTFTNNQAIPKDDYLFTLGADATSKDSEFDYFVNNRRLCLPHQYVSVERDEAIYNHNVEHSRAYKDPTFLKGDFAEQFEHWYSNLPTNSNAAIVNLDLMCGARKAIPSIVSVLLTLHTLQQSKYSSILVINLLRSHRQAENYGIKFDNVLDALRSNELINNFLSKKLTLIDHFQYHNKTIGKGARNSLLETLIFVYYQGKKKETKMATKKKSSARKTSTNTELARKRSRAAKKAWATRRKNAKS